MGAREELTMHYIRHKWLDTEKNLTESELVKLALSKIENDPSLFDVFIDMLRNTAGMSWVLGKITGGKLSSIYYFHFSIVPICNGKI